MTTFRALDTVVEVLIDDRVPNGALVEALVKLYPRSSAPATLRYRLGPTSVRRDEVDLPIEHARDVIPQFEIDLYEQVVARAECGWLLHAAAIEVAGTALVLTGPSGAGKTTLTLALMSRGLRPLTEEIVWIGKDGLVRGLPRPLHVSASGPERERFPADWEAHPYALRTASGPATSTVLIPPADQLCLGELPLRAIVHMGHGPTQATILETSPAHEVLHRLWNLSLRQDDGALEAATAVLREHRCYEMSSRTVAEAVELLEPLLNPR